MIQWNDRRFRGAGSLPARPVRGGAWLLGDGRGVLSARGGGFGLIRDIGEILNVLCDVVGSVAEGGERTGD